MNWTNIAIGFFLTIHIIVCLLMVFIILMQRSKQEGLGAAFGGGITDSMFGAQTSQVLVKATVWLAILFFGLTMILARLYATRNTDSALKKALMAAPANPVPALPTASASPTTVPADPVATPLSAPAAPAKK